MRSPATVEMPGTCGELVQGTINGVSFHVTCPVDIYSKVKVKLNGNFNWNYSSEHSKAIAAVKKTLSFLGQPNLGGKLTIQSSLPISKGMASSTADVVAAIEATSLALERKLSKKQVAELALSVEPTDGSLFPGIVLFDHRQGNIYEPLGSPPPIDIVVLDFGGKVDTVAFNHHDISAVSRKLEPQIAEALNLVHYGIATGNPQLVGQGATISARANQQILFKPQLEHVISLASEAGAVGVNVAHSRTVIGVLLDVRRSDKKEVADFLKKRLTELEGIFLCSLIGGGCKFSRNSAFK